jgi:hypothetical protein
VKTKKKLSQSDLRLLGVQPGLQAVRYPAGTERAEVKQLTAESRRRLSTAIFTRRHTNPGTEEIAAWR